MKMLYRLSACFGAVMFCHCPVGAAAIGDKLGTIEFEVSTRSEDARVKVVRGVKLLHHMEYIEADRAFAAAITSDPDCALAYWGRAMTLIHPLWPDVPSAADLKQGWDWVTTGIGRGTKTARERAYLRTMDVYYRDAAQHEYAVRLRALDEAWAQVSAEHPSDLNAAAFSALFHLAPARFLPKDKSHRIQLESAAILQQIIAQNPDHPGALHYKIHAFDFPLLAGRALEVCDTYGTIAPDVPHALHMPTHIYTRRGLWEKSIEYNRRSAEAARQLSGTAGITHFAHAHALDYLVYAYLQRGQYDQAATVRLDVINTKGPYVAGNRAATAFAFAAIPARYALERQDWSAAAKLELRQPADFPWNDQFLYCDSLVQFARAIGATRSGLLDAARHEVEELDRIHRKIAATMPNSYWASQAETQLLAARGWLKFKQGAKEEAFRLLRRATELEASADKEAVTPGEVLPAGELLGDMLAEADLPREALAAYEAAQELTPNRFNTLHGAAAAAEKAGDTSKARQYYQTLLDIGAEATPSNQRLEHAKSFLARNASPTPR